jgi:hypothetical protein
LHIESFRAADQQLSALNFFNHLANVGTILRVGQARVPRAQKLRRLVIQHPREGGTYGDKVPFGSTQRGAEASTGKKALKYITFLQEPSF